MYEIKANIADVRGAAAEIDTQSSAIRKEVQEIADLMAALRQTFLGNRAGDFFNKFDTAHSQMAEWDKIVTSFSEELKEAAARYEAADSV